MTKIAKNLIATIRTLLLLVLLVIPFRVKADTIDIMQASQNASIQFDTDSSVLDQYSEKRIAIKVLTGSKAINAVSAIVKYDPEKIEIIDIDTTNSFCDQSFFIEKEINKEKGEIRIVCGIPNSGFNGSVGVVAELIAKPLTLKPVSLDFTEETQVLASDGLGTNVLGSASDAYYEVIPHEYIFSDIKKLISIFSDTHPNSNRWYKSNDVKLVWPPVSNGAYYYSVSQNPDFSVKDKVNMIIDNHLDISLKNGINYFHLQAKDKDGNLGPVSSFKIMIDNLPPSVPEIKVISENIAKGDIIQFNFSSKDALSGIQPGFFVKINNGVFLPVKSIFSIPFMESGIYTIVARAYDKANNFSENKKIIYIR